MGEVHTYRSPFPAFTKYLSAIKIILPIRSDLMEVLHNKIFPTRTMQAPKDSSLLAEYETRAMRLDLDAQEGCYSP